MAGHRLNCCFVGGMGSGGFMEVVTSCQVVKCTECFG
jgi:hypothetical protein